MKEINVRELLRNFKLIFPIPEDGIKVKRRGGDFYMYPSKKRKTPAVSIAPIILNTEINPPIFCNWPTIMSGARCDNLADKHVQITDIHDSIRTEESWRKIHLCSHHLAVIESTGVYSIKGF